MLVYAWLLSVQNRLREDRGATAVEYGLLVAGIAALIVVTVFLIGPALDGMFNDVLGQLNGAPAAP